MENKEKYIKRIKSIVRRLISPPERLSISKKNLEWYVSHKEMSKLYDRKGNLWGRGE